MDFGISVYIQDEFEPHGDLETDDPLEFPLHPQHLQSLKPVEPLKPQKKKTIRWHLNPEQIQRVIDGEEVTHVRPTPVVRKDTNAKKKLMPVDRDLEARDTHEEDIPLPPSYQFLEEVFKSMDLIIPILHQRKERLTVSRLLTLVQKNIRKNVMESDLQKILHVLPDAYHYSWEKSEVSRKYILEIGMPIFSSRLTTTEIMARRRKFHSSLVKIHTKNPMKDMVDVCDFPAKPFVKPMQCAAQVLQNSRHLFEIPARCETPKPPPKPILKKLHGLPPKLIEKIVAKENNAREMFPKKGRVEKIKRLKRMPNLARGLKNIFTSEEKTSLPLDIIVHKAASNHPMHFPTETIISDLRCLIEVSQPWVDNPTVQGIEYLKLNKDIDVNDVVKDLENLLEVEVGVKQTGMSGDSYFEAQAEKVVTSDNKMDNLASPMELEYNEQLHHINLPYETEVSM